MADIREISPSDTAQIAEAILELRPRWKTEAALVDFIDGTLRPTGYRLVGAFEPGSDTAAAALGFRRLASTAWGWYLYVDDLSTLPRARGRGLADALLQWVAEEARRSDCEAIHLDSGVGADRAPAHRLYMRHRLRISAHHFQGDI